MKNIIPALIAAKQGFKPIPKDGVNPHYKKRYSTLDAVLGAVEPALHANGLTLVQVLDCENGQSVLKTHLYHSSGECLTSVYPLTNAGDSQKFGVAITYARRYSVSALLSVTADEDDDGEATKSAPQSKAPAKPKSAYITEKQAFELTDKATATGYTMDAFKLMVTTSGYKSRSVIPAEMFADILKVASDPEQADAWNEAAATDSKVTA